MSDEHRAKVRQSISDSHRYYQDDERRLSAEEVNNRLAELHTLARGFNDSTLRNTLTECVDLMQLWQSELASLRAAVKAAESYRERVRNQLSNAEWNVTQDGAQAWFDRETYNKLMATDPFNRAARAAVGEE